jgi:hypothetical protein
MLNANLTTYQKGAYCAGMKLFIIFPSSIKSLNHDIKVFKPALKDYLLSQSGAPTVPGIYRKLFPYEPQILQTVLGITAISQ